MNHQTPSYGSWPTHYTPYFHNKEDLMVNSGSGQSTNCYGVQISGTTIASLHLDQQEFCNAVLDSTFNQNASEQLRSTFHNIPRLDLKEDVPIDDEDQFGPATTTNFEQFSISINPSQDYTINPWPSNWVSQYEEPIGFQSIPLEDYTVYDRPAIVPSQFNTVDTTVANGTCIWPGTLPDLALDFSRQCQPQVPGFLPNPITSAPDTFSACFWSLQSHRPAIMVFDCEQDSVNQFYLDTLQTSEHQLPTTCMTGHAYETMPIFTAKTAYPRHITLTKEVSNDGSCTVSQNGRTLVRDTFKNMAKLMLIFKKYVNRLNVRRTGKLEHSYEGIQDPQITCLDEDDQSLELSSPFQAVATIRIPGLGQRPKSGLRHSRPSISRHGLQNDLDNTPGELRYNRLKSVKRDITKCKFKKRRQSEINKVGCYRCTFPDCMYENSCFIKKSDWERHEGKIHLHIEKWTCIPDGGYLITDEDGCVFCTICHKPKSLFQDPLDFIQDHVKSKHRGVHRCVEGGIEKSIKYRKQQFHEHMKLHLGVCKLGQSDQYERLHCVKQDLKTIPRSRCGYCEQIFDDWKLRCNHIAKEHFELSQRDPSYTLPAWNGGCFV